MHVNDNHALLKQATQILPPELCGEMLRFLYHLGMNLIERTK